MKKLFYLFVAVSVAGLAGCNRLNKDSIDVTGDQLSDKSEQSEMRGNAEPSSPDTIDVSEVSDGSEVVATEVSLSQPGFFVVLEDDNGLPGDAIGVSGLLEAGVVGGLKVNLDRRINDEVIYMQLYHDDGDGQFDKEVDVLVLDENSNRIEVQRIVGNIPFMEAGMEH